MTSRALRTGFGTSAWLDHKNNFVLIMIVTCLEFRYDYHDIVN